MKKQGVIICVIAAAVLAAAALPAVAASDIVHLDGSRGLSNNYVRDFAQDRSGYVWVATESGLNRFDGTDFTAFRTARDGRSIAANELNRLYADTVSNTLWIATQRYGLDALDCNSYTFRHYSHRHDDENSLASDGVTSVSAASDGGIWISTYTDGLDHLDPATGLFEHYNSHTVGGWHDDKLWQAVESADGKIYIGHVDAGFSVFDPATKRFRNYRHNAADTGSLPGDEVRALAVDRRGHVWIGTNSGLAVFRPETDSFINFRHNSENPHSLISNTIYGLEISRDGHLWIATENGGVSVLDISGSLMHLADMQFNNYAGGTSGETVSNKTVQAIFEDSFGNIWIGTSGDGIDVMSRRQPRFRLYEPESGCFSPSDRSVMSVCADNDFLLAGTDAAGLDIFNSSGQHIANVNRADGLISDNAVLAMLRTRSGEIWIGTYGGSICRRKAGADNFEKLNTGIISDVRALTELPDGSVAAGHGHGLTVIAPDGNINHYSYTEGTIREQWLRALLHDSQGRLWVGSFGDGISVYGPGMQLLQRFTVGYGLYSNTVNHLAEDTRGRVWAATADGLVRFDATLAFDTIFTVSDGLADANIRALLPMASGAVWMSTSSGVSCLTPDGEFLNYGAADGIERADFSCGALAAMPDGTIFLGSHYGIYAFNPEPTAAEDAPPVTFTELDIIGPDNNPQIIYSPSGRIELPYDHNTLRICFNVLDIADAPMVKYYYNVEGMDSRWFPVDGNNSITLRNLGPGDYRVAVRASQRNSHKAGMTTFLPLHISPPLWATWWAKLLYVLIAAGALIWVIRFYKKRLALEYALDMERRNSRYEQELNAERMRFFTNITHELRTPLTLILGPLEELKDDAAIPPRQSKRIKAMYHSAGRLLELINTILEFRKTETQNRALKVEYAGIDKLVGEIGRRYSELNTNPALEITVVIEPGDYHLWHDPEVIAMIVDNLMSNACKYTYGGTVELRLHHTEESGVPFTEIMVSDTGRGIDESTMQHIFDRYYRDSNAENRLGTGIGLALVYNLVKLHEGEIFVDSEPNRGSVFRFRMHSDNTYPDAARRIPQASVAENTSDESTAADDGEKPVVLVVEDNLDIVDYIRDTLSEHYNVASAPDGAAGLERALELLPDMIISDIMMPEMDGISMIRRLKDKPETAHIPVIVVTAKTAGEARVEAYEAGADSFISKPFSPHLLRTRIRNIFEARHSLALAALSSAASKEKPAAEAPATDKDLIVSSISEHDAEFMHKVEEIIKANIGSEALDVGFIAERMFMSHSTLYRKIKTISGMTVTGLIRKLRVHTAAGLIAGGRYTVSEISYMVGMTSPGNFRQAFREEFGVTPSAYKPDRK